MVRPCMPHEFSFGMFDVSFHEDRESSLYNITEDATSDSAYYSGEPRAYSYRELLLTLPGSWLASSRQCGGVVRVLPRPQKE